MIIKTIWVYSLYLPTTLFSKSSLKTIKILTMLQLTAKHKERKTSLRKDLKRWKQSLNSQNSLQVQIQSVKYNFSFQCKHYHHTVLLEASQLLEHFQWKKRHNFTVVTFWLLQSSFLLWIEINFLLNSIHWSQFYVLEPHTHKTTLLASWLHLGSLKHIFPKIFPEYTQFLCSLL